jgi:hypothetical protein
VSFTAEIDLVGGFGVEGSISFVLDLDDLLGSGINVSGGLAGGANVGWGVGAGYALRDVEGTTPLQLDVNLGPGSLSVLTDDLGFNGVIASYGSGIGMSTSIQKSYTLSARMVVDFVKGLFR